MAATTYDQWRHPYANAGTPLKPLKEAQEEDDEAAGPAGRGFCACFGLFRRCRSSPDQDGEEGGILLRRKVEGRWKEMWKKVREASEVLAGPKWKTIVRRVGRYCRGGRYTLKRGQFQYDARSYALNFDDDDNDDAGFYADFEDEKRGGGS